MQGATQLAADIGPICLCDAEKPWLCPLFDIDPVAGQIFGDPFCAGRMHQIELATGSEEQFGCHKIRQRIGADQQKQMIGAVLIWKNRCFKI
ncbi:MAG: hypothetical protein ACKO9F_21640, partial [Caldilinea sp.]